MENKKLPSTHQIGDPVWIGVQGKRISGYIRAVTFTVSKVRYAVIVYEDEEKQCATTFHNLDSALVDSRPEDKPIEFSKEDNYS